jgi:hypothetical protein
MDEVPRGKRSLLALHEQNALAGDDEEVFLAGLCVVQPPRPTRLKHPHVDAELGEGRLPGFEEAGRPEHVVRLPRRVAQVDDEPAVGDGPQAGTGMLERRLVYHRVLVS